MNMDLIKHGLGVLKKRLITEIAFKISRFLILTLIGISVSVSVSAQQPFTPLKQGEYEIVEESSYFNPGAQIEGSYKAFYATQKEGIVNGENISGKLFQDIELRIKSKINTNMSVNAYLGNRSTLVSDQDDSYDNNYPDEEGDASDDAMLVIFREAYLEYNHNPNAKLKIGKQFINVGDGIGLIYQGRANAISQQCRIGTWCYYVGGARLGEGGDAALYWVQLDYPVYESGSIVSDPWVKKGTRQELSFNVELLNIRYEGHHIPASNMGMWTGEHSTYHATTVNSSNNTDYVYFDNNEVSYMGFNLGWNYYDFLLKLNWLVLDGKRHYYVGADNAGQESLSKKDIFGNAVYLNVDYRIYQNWNVNLTGFSASGSELEDGENFWERNSTAFMEVQKGDFGDAIIYFNGKYGVGEGHSVSNLNFYSLDVGYRSDKSDLIVNVAYYVFSRNQAVYYNVIGEEEKKSTKIGQEVDIKVTWRIEDKVDVGAFIAVLQPDNAYTPNDNVRPTGEEKEFTLMGLNLSYEF
ncbi:hypothetical protein KJ966_15880 [bacterium]|nr:hypothetical protein [bacterium]